MVDDKYVVCLTLKDSLISVGYSAPFGGMELLRWDIGESREWMRKGSICFCNQYCYAL